MTSAHDPRLAAVVAEVRLHAEAALLRRLDAGAGFADPRIPAQIYLRDAASNARLAGGTLRPRGTHAKALEEVEALIARGVSAASTAGSRLDVARERLGLDAAAGGILAAALAYALCLDTRELCHALAPRRRPGLYVETCSDVLRIPPPALLPAIASGSPLRRGRLVDVEGDGLAASIELSSSALAWLLGDDRVGPPIGGIVELVDATDDATVALPANVTAALDGLVPRLSHGQRVGVTLRGPRGSGRRAAATRLARALGRPLAVIPVPVLVSYEQRARISLLSHALAAIRLRDALPYLADADALYDERGDLSPEHVDAIASAPGAILAGTTGGGGHLEMHRASFSVTMPRAELEDRERAWASVLAHTDLAPEGAQATAAELAARYVIGPGAIADVVSEASRHSAVAGTPVDLDGLEAAVGRRLSLRLGSYGSVMTRKARFSELVLPDEVFDTLHDMIAMVRERTQILERWGYQRHLGISRGVSALFAGEPGTGKTMAASVVASELGLELVRIDLSAVISKYVGETEKNLAKIFDEAQDAHAMLLFDEADSLFGKRTELKTAQDRFANLEVNYILQRMETFDGVSVLTTNAENAIDPALQRRLNFRIRFPEPEVEERVRLWRQLLPPQAGLHDSIDFAALAERFEMTGGYIKNAVVRAAVIAARAGRAITAQDLWAGAHHEYAEMGKVMHQL